VRVVNTLVVSPFEVPGRDASEANKEKNKKKLVPKKNVSKLGRDLVARDSSGHKSFRGCAPSATKPSLLTL